MPKSAEDRITDLEMTIMHLERRLGQLDEVVTAHTRELDTLARVIKSQKQRIERLEGAVTAKSEDLAAGELTEGYEYGLDGPPPSPLGD
jgi:uncharacterized coiled-coil protein SlyX